MDSFVWPIAHSVALLAQLIFLSNISSNLAHLYKTKKLKQHLNYGAVLAYAILLVVSSSYIFLLWNQSELDHATRLTCFRIFGVGSASLGLVLASYSHSAKKKLLAS